MGNNETEDNVILHSKVRKYLQIESEVNIDQYCYYMICGVPTYACALCVTNRASKYRIIIVIIPFYL